MTIDLAKLRAETLALIDGTTPGTACTHCYGRSANDRCLNCGAYLPAPTLAADTLRLLDDNLRLRSVLQDIVESWDWWTVDEYDRDRGGLADSIDAARAALAEGGPR